MSKEKPNEFRYVHCCLCSFKLKPVCQTTWTRGILCSTQASKPICQHSFRIYTFVFQNYHIVTLKPFKPHVFTQLKVYMVASEHITINRDFTYEYLTDVRVTANVNNINSICVAIQTASAATQYTDQRWKRVNTHIKV